MRPVVKNLAGSMDEDVRRKLEGLFAREVAGEPLTQSENEWIFRAWFLHREDFEEVAGPFRGERER
jgi:hypothetical protein